MDIAPAEPGAPSGSPAAPPRSKSSSRLTRMFRVFGMGLDARAALAQLPAADLSWRERFSPAALKLVHEARLAYYPANLLDHPACVVDVGAYIGDWSQAMLRCVAPRLLIAVEPMPQSFRVLERTIGVRPNVRLVACAVGAHRDRATLHVTNMANFNSLLPLQEDVKQYYPGLRESETVDVDVLPLDEVLADVPEVSILKIDVQGAEIPLLDGARDVLKRTRAVQLEVQFVSHYQGDALFEDLHARMVEYGFALYNFAPPNYGQDGRMIWTDAIYMNGAA